MQADTNFATDLPIIRYIASKSADRHKYTFGCPGNSNAPNLVPNTTQTPQTGSLSLVADKASTPIVFLPVKFSDLAVSDLIDSGATYNFLAASLLPKLQD